MLEQLFGSKTRVKLLHFFFRTPEESYYVRQLARELDTQINAIRRELESLLALGIIIEKEAAQKKQNATKAGASLRKYYQVNPSALLYPELHALLMKDIVAEQEEFISKLKDSVGDLKMLVLTGSFTGDKSVDTDILIVGEVKPRTLDKLVTKYEKDLGFPIRYTIMTEQEFMDRRYVMDKFIYGIFEADHMRVINNLDV